jgi:tetratricopeptide (TPR) repeat protein
MAEISRGTAYLEGSLRIAESAGFVMLQGNCCKCLGDHALLQGNDAGPDFYRRAVEAYKVAGTKDAATSVEQIGGAFLRALLPNDAASIFSVAADIFGSIGDLESQGRALQSQAQALIVVPNRAAAIPVLKTAANVLRSVNRAEATWALLQAALLLRGDGLQDSAIELLEDARRTCPDDSFNVMQRIIGEMLQLVAPGPRHADLHRHAAQSLERQGLNDRASDAFGLAADEFKDLGDNRQAGDCYQKALDLATKERDAVRDELMNKLILVSTR